MLFERPLGIQELNVTLTGMTQKLDELYSALGVAELGKVWKRAPDTWSPHMDEAHADTLIWDLLNLSCAFQYDSNALDFPALFPHATPELRETLIHLPVTLLPPWKYLGHW